MEDQNKKLPAALTAAREAAGLTQKELADKIGRTQQAVAKWENGESVPTRRSMTALVQTLPELAKLNLPMLDAPTTQQTHTLREPLPGTVPNHRAALSFNQRIGRGSRFSFELEEHLPEPLRENMSHLISPVDYLSEKLAIEIAGASLPINLSLAWTNKLWRLSSFMRENNDARTYVLLAVETPYDELTPHEQVVKQRQTAILVRQAALHGIQIITVNTPEQAAAIIEALESDDSTTD